jgi:hypothetical protein
MRCNWCNGEEEGLVGFNGLVKEAMGLLGKHIRAVLAFVVFGLVLVALKRAIEVVVGSWVKQKVLGWSVTCAHQRSGRHTVLVKPAGYGES